VLFIIVTFLIVVTLKLRPIIHVAVYADNAMSPKGAYRATQLN